VIHSRLAVGPLHCGTGPASLRQGADENEEDRGGPRDPQGEHQNAENDQGNTFSPSHSIVNLYLLSALICLKPATAARAGKR
jgi:hypothetical protein